MKTRQSLITVAALAVFFLLPAVAKADPITFTLDDNRNVALGGSVTFFGTLSNAGNPERFLDQIDILIAYAGPGSLTVNDSAFFALPPSLASGASTGLSAFFSVAASALVTPGTYFGTATVHLSDAVGNVLLVTQEFSITVIQGTAPVPEPATMFLLGSGLAGLAAAKRRRNKRRQATAP